MDMPTFIVGAGFSLAANAKYATPNKQLAKRYPLASALGVECFGSSWNKETDVESAFAAALQKGDYKPVAKLVELIQTADYYLGSAEAKDPDSVYCKFIERFPGAQFISFNYDSLLEQILLHKGLWNPGDGFGVHVETGKVPHKKGADKSKTLVIHLHGTVLLYSVESSWKRTDPQDITHWRIPIEPPVFRFDPDSLGPCFISFKGALPDSEYRSPEYRVIAPVPDKSKGLRESYVEPLFTRACELLKSSEHVIAIGYRFAECDLSSFKPLLKTILAKDARLSVVTPDASDIESRLKKLYPSLRVNPVPVSFENWVKTGFGGLGLSSGVA